MVNLATLEVQQEVVDERLLVPTDNQDEYPGAFEKLRDEHSLGIVEDHGHRIGPTPQQVRRHDQGEIRTRHLGSGQHTFVEEKL